jgi:hypothetical protein
VRRLGPRRRCAARHARPSPAARARSPKTLRATGSDTCRIALSCSVAIQPGRVGGTRTYGARATVATDRCKWLAAPCRLDRQRRPGRADAEPGWHSVVRRLDDRAGGRTGSESESPRSVERALTASLGSFFSRTCRDRRGGQVFVLRRAARLPWGEKSTRPTDDGHARARRTWRPCREPWTPPRSPGCGGRLRRETRPICLVGESDPQAGRAWRP